MNPSRVPASTLAEIRPPAASPPVFTLIADPARIDGAPAEVETFTNPIAPGADPWVVRHGGFYYWCASENDLAVVVYRTERLTQRGEKTVVWRAPETGPYCGEIWAPELHRLDGTWYILVAASNGKNETHRMIVLEAVGDEPTDGFRFKSELYTGDEIATGRNNRWAIDGTILEHKGERYLLWSGWADERDEQWLYIARMANPWTVSSNRVRLCANDDYPWERVDETVASRGLNEAPQVLVRGGRVFVVFSASASWATSYKLGLLELIPGGDPMDPRAWRKQASPVLQATEATWGVGHCGFTQSPDGREDWLVFHAKLERRHNWKRAVHVQRFAWDDTGAPVFGAPVAAGRPLAVPGGEAELAAAGRRNVTDEVAAGRAALAAAIGEQPMVREVRVREV
jgi:GH43 family beta-xylosidase